MNNSDIFLFQKDLITETVGEGVKRQIMGYDENLMLVKVEFETGGIGSIHKHSHVQTTYVASGRFEVNIDGEKQILAQGDGFFVPSDAPHGVVCIEAGILIDVFNPVRKDFLKD